MNSWAKTKLPAAVFELAFIEWQERSTLRCRCGVLRQHRHGGHVRNRHRSIQTSLDMGPILFR
jgi:hypothetical protein